METSCRGPYRMDLFMKSLNVTAKVCPFDLHSWLAVPDTALFNNVFHLP